jgi:hypothetical protein
VEAAGSNPANGRISIIVYHVKMTISVWKEAKIQFGLKKFG